MPKVTIVPQQRIWEFPGSGFQVYDEQLWCPYCREFVDYMKKCVIKSHVMSRKHAKNRENYQGPLLQDSLPCSLQTVQMAKDAKSAKTKKRSKEHSAATQQNWISTVAAFADAGVSLLVFDNLGFRTWLKDNLKNCNSGLPVLKTLLADIAGPSDIMETAMECQEKDVCILLNEMPFVGSDCNVLHLFIVALGQWSRFRLLATKFLTSYDPNVIVEFILSALNLAGIKRRNVVTFMSATANYLIVVGRELQVQCVRLHHVMCWAQVLQVALEEVRSSCRVLDEFVSAFDSALFKCPQRRQDLMHVLECAGMKRELPPTVTAHAVTWLKAVQFHMECIDQETEWIAKMDHGVSTTLRLKDLMSRPDLRDQMLRICKIFPSLWKAVEAVDKDDLTVSCVWQTMHTISDLLASVGLPVVQLKRYFEGALPSPRFWRIVEIFDPHRVSSPEVLQTDFVKELERFEELPIPVDEVLLYGKTLSNARTLGFQATPLQFWTTYSGVMPNLSRLALKILSIPVTTAFIERRIEFLAKSSNFVSVDRDLSAIELRLLFNSKSSVLSLENLKVYKDRDYILNM